VKKDAKKDGPKEASPKRIRRTPEQAREVILAAAAERLAKFGPNGLKITDIAKDAGLTHATLIHHFGSAAELQRQLARRFSAKLLSDVVERLSGGALEATEIEAIIGEIFEIMSDRGNSRLVAWLRLTGVSPGQEEDPADSLLADVAKLVAERRIAGGAPDTEQTRKESKFIVLLAANAAIGDGVGGELTAQMIGLDEKDAKQGFRKWFAAMLAGYAGDQEG
jgi:AcrR family transcriptional regulator